MLKGLLIRIVLDTVFDWLLTVLREKAKDSSSNVDDKFVEVLASEQGAIKQAIRDKL